MPRRGSGREEPRIEVDIGRDTTSLVIRRLPQHITTERLVEVLRESSRGRFDFVHVPHDQQTGLNVALAFVNFVDHDAAEKAYRTRLMRPNGGRNPLGPIRIRPGTIQGLGPNLAYFTTRFGLDALEGLSAPQVFEGGSKMRSPCSFPRKPLQHHEFLQISAFQGTARPCPVHGPGLTEILLIPPARTQGILPIRLSLLQASDLI